jgi:hypothetical protein
MSNSPNTLIIASTHGNEPAGYHAIEQYIKMNPNINKGNITFIPAINSCGLLFCTRNNPLGDYDINRNYPNKTFLNSHITKFIDQADWVFDLHEGWSFNKLDSSSIGSGVYPGNTQPAIKLCENIVNHINKDITVDYKKFVTKNIPNIKGSLRNYCKNKNYILVETSGINDIQPLELRIEQQLKILKYIINYLHIN